MVTTTKTPSPPLSQPLSQPLQQRASSSYLPMIHWKNVLRLNNKKKVTISSPYFQQLAPDQTHQHQQQRTLEFWSGKDLFNQSQFGKDIEEAAACVIQRLFYYSRIIRSCDDTSVHSQQSQWRHQNNSKTTQQCLLPLHQTSLAATVATMTLTKRTSQDFCINKKRCNTDVKKDSWVLPVECGSKNQHEEEGIYFNLETSKCEKDSQRVYY